jgi:hypothetical protein
MRPLTAIAFLFAVRGRIRQHREWMTRSYAVGLVFFEGRVIRCLTGLESNAAVFEAVVWSCLVFALLFADLAIHWSDIRHSATARPKLAPPLSATVSSEVGAD